MMKVNLGKVEARVAYHVSAEGSVLAQTVQARADRIEIHYDVESTDEPVRVAGLIRNARNGCYVRQMVLAGHLASHRPELFHDTITLNGKPFDLDDYPPPARE